MLRRLPTPLRFPTRRSRLAAVAAAALLFAALPSQATEDYSDCFTIGPDGCPVQKVGCPLVQPPTIWAAGGALDTQLTVKLRDATCVPLLSQGGTPSETSVEWADMTLRNFYSPVTPEGALTGPTWRLRKAELQDPNQNFDATSNPEVKAGDRLRVLLRNSLPNDPTTPANACRPELYSVCSDNPLQVCTCEDPNGACVEDDPSTWTCDASDPSRTCRLAEIEQFAPNCFHGPEVTNLHYHGTHVSPQPHQDFVLLQLYSENQVDPPPPDPAGNPAIAVGTYQTDINPLPWNQPPGTHWYHPHKHGSTAVQLFNGLAGAMLFAGEFDDFLYDTYGVDASPGSVGLERFEKVLVMQQIFEEPLFFNPGTRPTGYPPYPLINGQLVPTIEMRYGEVQRWRFISATSNATTQGRLNVTLDPETFPGFEVKQIAQDGIQFHPTNYIRQPLGNAVDGYELSPGNRVDLLVRAPDPPPGGGDMTFYVTRNVFGGLPELTEKQMAAQNALVNRLSGFDPRFLPEKDQSSTGALVRVHVSGVQMPTQYLPSTLPDMPPYLADLEEEAFRWVEFSMVTGNDGTSSGTTPQSAFFINGLQYGDDCAGQTVQLNKTEEWRVLNTSTQQHPFHIHINPFQITFRRWNVDAGGDIMPTETQTFDPPYPWMDTIALKPGRITRPSVTKLLYLPEDYTGAYVLHCHFLGHEDRGMMTNVQAVCPGADLAEDPIQFGTPDPSGRADDCSVAPADTAPLVACPGSPVNGAGGGHGHGLHGHAH